MDPLWTPYGPLWTSYGTPITPYGPTMDTLWTRCGPPLDPVWTSCFGGKHTELVGLGFEALPGVL